jgi:hypothetical protein
MRAIGLAWLLASVLSACVVTPCRAQDVVTTKDSTEFKGRIVEEAPGSHLVIRTMGGEVDTISWDNVGVIRRGEWPGKKSPWLAWGLSFVLLPGMGQFYNGDVGKGIAFSVVGLASTVMMIAGEESSDDALGALGGMLFLGSWIASWVEAPIRSSAINRQRGYSLAPPLSPARREAMLPPEADGMAPLIPLAQVTVRF